MTKQSFKNNLQNTFTRPNKYTLYRRSEILKLNDLFNFEVAKLMHEIIYKKLPKILNHT